MWIYQFSLGSEYAFTPEEFRYQIWEGQRTRWPYQIKRAKEPLAIGDTLVFFFTPKGGNSDPGVYGWAVVDRCDIKNKVSFIPTTPTNHLKMHPWWDKENELSKNLLGEIRGGMKQGTLFWFVRNIRFPRFVTELSSGCINDTRQESISAGRLGFTDGF